MNNTPFTIAQMRPIRDGHDRLAPCPFGRGAGDLVLAGRGHDYHARKLRLHHALYRGRGRRLLCAGRRCTPHADMPR